MPEVILLEPDPETRLLIRSLLERDGYRVVEARDLGHAQDVIRGSDATRVLCGPQVLAQDPEAAQQLSAIRPNLDVLGPSSFGAALLDGAGGGEGLSEFARDSLLLLAVLAEEGAKRPAVAEKLGRMAELTGVHMDLSRRQLEETGAAASLVALGPSLVSFRFGVDPGGGAEGGLGKDLQAALAAASAVRCPYVLVPIISSVDERFDGRGRPRGLQGRAIPIGARIIAVVREYCVALAGGKEAVDASEEVRARSGTDFDPKVVEAFFRALRDESYVERLTGGEQGPRILVADADASSQSITEMRLAGAGFSVETCGDGAEAYERIVSDPPQLVVADTVLPKLDGISLLLKLRRSPAKHVPVLFVSSRTDAGLLNKALKLGAKDVLAKPVNYEVLIAKLRAMASAMQSAAPAARQTARGNLAEMPVPDLFRVLALGRRTCKVTINGPGDTAQVVFEGGSPVAAFTTQHRGRVAFELALGFTQGTFDLVMGEAANEHNLERGLEAMLLHGYRDAPRTPQAAVRPAPARPAPARPAPPPPSPTPERTWAPPPPPPPPPPARGRAQLPPAADFGQSGVSSSPFEENPFEEDPYSGDPYA